MVIGFHLFQHRHCVAKLKDINKDYSELDEAMLSEMSVPKLMGEIGSDYEKYLYLLKKFCLNIAKQQEIEESDIGNYVRLRKKLSRL